MIITVPPRRTPKKPAGPKPVITLQQRVVTARSPQEIKAERGRELAAFTPRDRGNKW